MSNIPTSQASALFTQALIDYYKEMPQPTAFLRSFFPTKTTSSKLVSIEVQRGTERVAVDVVRGTDGQRNTFGKSSEKVFEPPYFREYFDFTQLQSYDRLFGATEISDAAFADLINSAADHVSMLRAKIERAVEKMAAEFIISGTVTTSAGDSIDFKRKAASIVNPGGGNYWANNVDPFAQLQAGCEFIRTKGKSQGGVFNLILGQGAWTDLLSNTEFTSRQNLVSMTLDAVAAPQRNAVGAAYMGRITAGSWLLDVWTYPEYYENSSGTSVEYIDSKYAIILPQTPRFHTAFAAVPQLLTPGQPVVQGDYIVSEYIDTKAKTHEFHVESAPLVVPVAVDQVYTLKAKA